ncbi:MAG TPA: glucose-6-phosphate dehydrogenase [Lentisphaeria bacterium]|nr:MAG: glucose-6-phosphate dehydrogenase [Lentisphaerae bacterium GWF2_38_69]HBM15838.1 glucose-6-phosphate dehydrogenase [Lentisphaeria bacterium]
MLNQTIISEGICQISKACPCSIVIFGASGDLTRKKLIPALFNLYNNGNIPDNFFLVGSARTKISDEDYQKIVSDILIKNELFAASPKINDFAKRCFYHSGDYGDINSYIELKDKMNSLSTQFKTEGNCVFNLAIPATLYTKVVEMLGKSGLLIRGSNEKPFHRIIIEKPFGRDYNSSVELNSFIDTYASDKQVYRIDHYMGKDTVQNIYVFRYGNSIFEPIWNRNCIDHIQITVAEDIGIGNRAGFYDQAGQMRDMLQNHLMHLLTCIAIEPPVTLSEENLRNEKKKLLRSIRPFNVDNISEDFVLGQYDYGKINNEQVKAYRSETDVPPNSYTETFFATKIFIDNWRWQGVPFYLRSGKRLKSKLSKISIVFKKTPTLIFQDLGISDRLSNVISFNIYPDQGVSLQFQAKIPEQKMCIGTLNMDFSYQREFGSELTSDYNYLILDCMMGDQTLFWRKDNVELSWKLLTPVLEKIENLSEAEKRELVHQYLPGSWGPKASEKFIEKDNRKWINK